MFASVLYRRLLLLAPLGLGVALAACTTAGSPSPEPLPSAGNPTPRDYQQQVRNLYLTIWPMCTRSRVANEKEAYAPARAEFDRYRRSIEGRPEAAQFDAGVKDAQEWRMVVRMRCPALNDDSTATVRNRVLAETRRALGELRRSARR